MKISVITVCYNSEKTIEKTIRSVINQSYKNIEYIVIDGDSKDKTRKIINKYKKFISKIKFEKDDGLYHALNKGINISTGRVISILHSDDIFYNNNTIKNISYYFKLEPNLKMLIGNVIFKKNFRSKKISRYYPSSIFKPWMMRFGYSPPHLSTFVKKDVYNKIGMYNKSYKIAGDFDFFLRCFFLKKLNFKKVNKNFVVMSPGGLSGRNFFSYYITTVEILKALKKHKIYSNIFFVLLRLPLKISQYFLNNYAK